MLCFDELVKKKVHASILERLNVLYQNSFFHNEKENIKLWFIQDTESPNEVTINNMIT